MFIDTHAHLDADIYAHELEGVIRRALQENVWIITVGSDIATSRRAIEIAEMFPEGVYAAVGLHPLKVPTDIKAEDKLVDLEAFREMAQHPKVVALGETGLDFSGLPDAGRKNPGQPLAERHRQNQINVLSAFLQMSKEFRLPLLLHCRDAHQEMLDLLETWDKTSVGFDARGIIHCFSGDWKQARRYFNLDFLVSLTGLITHAHFQAELIRKAPLNRLVIESDCPHLTPEPWSIRRNEPSFLPRIAASLAGIRGEPLSVIAEQTTANVLRVFSRIKKPS